MSLKAINHLKLANVSPTQKLVLLCLADCHNQDSERCDPSVSFIMQFTGLSNRAIATALKDLEAANLVKIQRGLGAKSSYKLNLTSEPASLVPDTEPVNDVPKPVNLPHPRTTFTSEPPSTTSEPPAVPPVNLLPKPVNEVHTNIEEQGIEQRKNRNSDKLSQPTFIDTDGESFRIAMTEWFDYKAKRKERYMPDGWNRLLTQQRRFPVHYVKASIDASIRNQWKGLFTEKITESEAVLFLEPVPQTEAAEEPHPLAAWFERMQARERALAEPPTAPDIPVEPSPNADPF